MENVDSLKLDNQICFPLYVLSKEITGVYRPFLEELDITYSQYLVLMVLWDKDGITVNSIGQQLYLDSGTLTPLLKRLEVKNLIKRKRKKEDERVVEIFLTGEGIRLKEKAEKIPSKIAAYLELEDQDLIDIKTTVNLLLTKLLPKKK